MSVKIFLIGRPGSGKSQASSDVGEFARNRNISVSQVNDYDILYEMFLADKNNQQFERIIENRNHQFRHIDDRILGFKVKDFKVLDTALKRVAKRLEELEHVAQLITVEFARNEYKKAFQEFTPELLQEAYFLYIETSVEICVQRVSNPFISFDSYERHCVPESILRGYYEDQGENKEYMASQFASDFKISPDHIMIVENEDSLEKFIGEIRTCTTAVFDAEKELLPDTEKIQLVLPRRLKQKQSIEHL